MTELSEVLTDLYSMRSALGSANGRLSRARHLVAGLRVACSAEHVSLAIQALSEAIDGVEKELENRHQKQPGLFP